MHPVATQLRGIWAIYIGSIDLPLPEPSGIAMRVVPTCFSVDRAAEQITGIHDPSEIY
jgi:hypothetical protein